MQLSFANGTTVDVDTTDVEGGRIVYSDDSTILKAYVMSNGTLRLVYTCASKSTLVEHQMAEIHDNIHYRNIDIKALEQDLQELYKSLQDHQGESENESGKIVQNHAMIGKHKK